MDPRRKRLYIIATVLCLLLSVGILGWSQFSSDSVDSAPVVVTPRATTAATASGDYVTGYRSPAVFPATDKFNTDVLSTAAFKNLQTYTPIGKVTELGRPDPFTKY